jgi:hypothetical protein
VQPQLEAILGRLNDKVAGTLGQALLVAQKPLRELAGQWIAGPVDQPYLSAAELLTEIVVGEGPTILTCGVPTENSYYNIARTTSHTRSVLFL